MFRSYEGDRCRGSATEHGKKAISARSHAGRVGRMALSLDELLGLEHRGWDALCRSDGAAFYSELMTDDGLMVLVNGMVLDRAQVAASLDGAPPWDEYDLDDARLVALGADAAALVYSARAQRAGEPAFHALMTSVYRLVEGAPRLALYQQTAAG